MEPVAATQDQRAKIVATVCDLLLDQITDDRAAAVVKISCDQDPDDGLSYFNYLVAIGLMPESIRASMDRSVLQSVCAFFRDFGIVCQTVEDRDCGPCILLHVPEKLDFSKAFQAAKPKPA